MFIFKLSLVVLLNFSVIFVFGYASRQTMNMYQEQQEVTALVIAADGFEDIELITIIDVLRRANVVVTLASVKSDLSLTGMMGVNIQADQTLDNISEEALYDAIVLPGGTQNAKTLADIDKVIDMIINHKFSDKYYAAICAAPAFVFTKEGILDDDQQITSYPYFKDRVGDHWVDQRVVISKKCITSQGPGTAMEFALTLVDVLVSEQKASDLAIGMIFQN